MSPMLPDYRAKYRQHIIKKYQRPEDGKSGHRILVPLNETYTKLIIANENGREHEILNRPWRHTGALSEQMAALTIDALFDADNDRPQTVVLLGVAGVGKTTMARKILLDWATGRLFPKRFDYVFYVSCRQTSLVTGQVNWADLVLNNEPELTPSEAMEELLVNPGKCLFIMDGFEELGCSIEQEEDNLSTNPCERKPLRVLLSDLFHRRVLPESCLIITTRPSVLGRLEDHLQTPRYVRLLGFSEQGREEYFLKFFGAKEPATQALSSLKRNEALFALSFVPSVCWIICTVMKQQLDEGKEHPVPMSEKLTAVYALYLSHLTESLCSGSEQQNLEGLCSLAADGLWKKKTLFEDKEMQKQSLVQLDFLPSALHQALFQKDFDCEGTYSFIHLSVQEFLAALFYVFEPVSKDSQSTKEDIKTLLDSCSSDQGDLTLTAQFIFGLLNKKIMTYLKEQFGWKISSRIKIDLLEWFKMDTQIKYVYPNYNQLERFHYLYEIQEEEFVKSALEHLTKLNMEALTFTQMDQVVLSFCIKNCLNLETLSLYRCLFQSKDQAEVHPGFSNPSYQLDGCKLTDSCCADLSTVLSTDQMLVELDLQTTNLKDSGVRLLGEGLIHPNCKLEKLGLSDCNLTQACCSELSAVLSTSQTLTELKLGCNSSLGIQGIHLLCEGLKHPNCKLQSLELDACDLTAATCQDLATVLSTSQALMRLNLESNKLGDAGVKLLCEGLKHPKCKLQTLLLSTCELGPACCRDLCSVLSTSQTLTELAVEYNNLEDSGVKLLCEGLKQSTCRLEKLGLAQCSITAACCGDLASVLTINQTLTELVVECNKLGDSGVKLLCEGLRHPRCRLQKLNLFSCDFTSACCGDLTSVLRGNRTLTEVLVGGNTLGDLGIKLLCEGLNHPNCTLQKLCLCMCEITAAGCGALSSVLSTNQVLEDIDLWNNKLEDAGMRLLCEGLKHPDSKLHTLSLWNCKFSAACCGDLCDVLSTSQSLKKLQLEGNELGDSGVMLLCEGLKHPDCRLKTIGLDTDNLTEDTLRELSCLKQIKPDLILDT
ncbi:NACHT, LRR and PYD domains-containing protein 3-like isoform X2 [Elgaria multicarinata webbii]|uniref:NACHT, LRR and PYD domains-containing protein 3-like isoform X2 n=1 Tax=Elgaria multicarinata webbii TaxID=159646 RepID=UPI002FCD2639